MGFNLNTVKKKWKVFAISIVILVFANAFNGLLNISSFEKIYTQSLVSIYYDAVSGLKRTIERKIRFGKPLDNFYGINLLLEQFKEKNPNIDNISIALPNGQILYSLNPKIVKTRIPQTLLADFSNSRTGKNNSRYIPQKKYNGYFHVFLDIKDRQKASIGIINITFPERIVKDQINKMVYWNIKRLSTTTAVVCTILFCWMMEFIDLNEIRAQRKRLYYTLFIFLCVGQMAYSYQSLNYFYDRHKNVIQLKTQGIQTQLQAEIERFLRAGLRLDKLGKMEKRLKQIVDSAPYIDSIQILNTDRQVLYFSGNQHTARVNAKKDLVLTTSLEAKKTVKGFIETRISKSEIQKKIIESALDSLTVILISMIFITEMLFLLFIFI